MTSEKYRPSKIQDNNLPTRVFALMSQTTLKLDLEIKRICYASPDQYKGMAVLCFGSAGRNEMLPNSDIDLALIVDDTAVESIHEDTPEAMVAKCSNLGYDKVEFHGVITASDLLEESIINSPESQKAKSKIIFVGDNFKSIQKISKAKEMITTRTSLEDNIAFNYFFLRHQAKQKSKEGRPNIKYCDGGPRDMMLIDRMASYLTDGESELVAEQSGRPEIDISVDLLDKIVSCQYPAETIKRALGIINEFKLAALMAKSKGLYFDGILSDRTTHIIKHQLGSDLSAEDLQSIFNKSRMIIKDLKDSVFKHLANNLRDENNDLVSLWEKTSVDRQAQMLRLAKSSRWVDRASVLCQSDCGSSLVRLVLDRALTDNDYYMLRLVINSPNTATKELMKIASIQKLSGDNDTNRRYAKILDERIGHKA